MQALAWKFHVGLYRTTIVHKIIHETSKALWDVLKVNYLKTPETEADWLSINQDFYTRWNFPHCLGSIDGKHITIQAPAKSGSLYYNYKKTFSVVLMASCDSQYKFTTVDIGAYGSQSDGGVFRLSVFGQKIDENEANIQSDSLLPGTNTTMPL